MIATSRFLLFANIDEIIAGRGDDPTRSLANLAERLESKGVPVIFTSKRSFSELSPIFDKLDRIYPCIVEDGGAIVTPPGFWNNEPHLMLEGHRGEGIVSLGVGVNEIRRRVRRIESALGESLGGITSMPIEDVALSTGLDFISAKRAQNRHYSEILCARTAKSFWDGIEPLLEKNDLSVSQRGGLRIVSSRRCDEGTAIQLFMDLLRVDRKQDDLMSIGIGARLQDTSLLASVDIAFQLQTTEASGWAPIEVEGVVQIRGSGLEGWALAMKGFFQSRDGVSEDNSSPIALGNVSSPKR